jgi:hypothetical protein
MILRGYATGHGDTIQSLLFELEAQLGAKELPPGEGDFRLLQQKIERLQGTLDLIRQIADGLNEGAPPYHDLRLCGKLAEGALTEDGRCA